MGTTPDTHPDPGDDAHRARLALLLAVVDGECDARVHDLLCTSDPHLAVEVAHLVAHDFVEDFDPAGHAELRANLTAELLKLAGEE